MSVFTSKSLLLISCTLVLISLYLHGREKFDYHAHVRLPSQEDWATLNSTVEGRLVRGVSFSQSCFSNFNSSLCRKVRTHYLDSELRSNTPGGYTNTQWETCQSLGQQCLLDYTDRANAKAVAAPWICEQGSVPDYLIDVAKPEDVTAAFRFTRKTGVRVVVKNTGHDYKGRSSGPNSLAIWTHHLKNMSFDRAFVAEGCQVSQPAVTLGAGVQFKEIYAFAEEKGFTFVGGQYDNSLPQSRQFILQHLGSDPGVGATGGWLQGGGHGGLSNTMGLGVDRVLQFKLVTPDGKYRVANACQNQDLFFALRGGGGGTFGVVLEATSQVSPPVSLQVAAVMLPSRNASWTRDLWSIVLDNGLRWAEEGWGSFLTGESALFVTPALDSVTAHNSMLPLLDYGDKLKDEGVNEVRVIFAEFSTWGNFFNTFAGTDSAKLGHNLALASRLLPKESFKTVESRRELLDALLAAHSITPGLRFLGCTPFNHPGDEGTSMTDAWRNSVYHITVVTTWNFNASLLEKEGQYKLASESINNLRRLTPDAAYSNEADIHEPNHEVTFWGKHYNELLRIKQRYDPDRLLDCWQCVGWKSSSPNFSCYI